MSNKSSGAVSKVTPCRTAVINLALVFLMIAPVVFCQEETSGKEQVKTIKIRTPPPTKPPLRLANITKLPGVIKRFDLFLLMGQSNMKGRGFMPEEPKNDQRIVMMHMKDDKWYVARHPLHLVGDAKTFEGANNAGVGPGLSFAETLLAKEPDAVIGLIPCAVGGTAIGLWQRDAELYSNAMRRAKLAIAATASVKPVLRGVLWLQGEADTKAELIPLYEESLLTLVKDLRADLGMRDLPFIVCTIGELRPDTVNQGIKAINGILMSLPDKVSNTACVDARDLKGHIGDFGHYDAASQEIIGRRYAEKYLKLAGGK